MQFFENALYQRNLVGVVVDDEIRREADGLAIDTQPAGTHAVESAHVQAAGILAEKPGRAFTHLARSLVRKRDREDSPGRHSVFDDKVGDPVRYDTCLTAARSRKDEHRAIAVRYGEALGLVQSFEKFRLGGNGFHSAQSNIGSFALSICPSPAANACAIVKTQGDAPIKRNY